MCWSFCKSKDTSVKMYHPASKKTDFCQDRPFFCERCWKGYYSRHKFEEHVKQHVKCSFDGCSFEALPYHVAKHTINAHSNSVFPANLGAHMKGLQRKHHRVGRTPSKKKELHNDVPTTSVDHSEKGRRENRPESKRRAQVEQRAEESIFHDLDKILNGATVTPKVKFELCDATCPLEKSRIFTLEGSPIVPSESLSGFLYLWQDVVAAQKVLMSLLRIGQITGLKENFNRVE
ncbi:hypothetical protein D918_00710 [Trichuris suis]|nr:hypothetical protein D918_00710 [Trichuris suis]